MSRQLGNTPFTAIEKKAYFSMNKSENTIHVESQLKKLELSILKNKKCNQKRKKRREMKNKIRKY